MMNKQKIANLLGAGTVTVLLVALLWAFRSSQATDAADPVATDMPTGSVEVVPLEDYNALQSENDQLQQALQTMQDRETQYQAQIEQANSLLSQQAAASAYETSSNIPTYRGEWEHEHEEHERAEHEHEGEYDD